MRERLTVLYIGLTCAAAVALVAAEGWLPTRSVQWTWWGAMCLMLVAVAAERLAVPLPKAGYVSVSTVAHVTGALLLPPAIAAIIFGAAMLIVQLGERARPSRLFFNTACTTATVGLTALLANWLGLSGPALGTGGVVEIVLFFLIASVNYAANLLLIAGVIAIASSARFWTVLRENVAYSAPAEFSAAVIGGLIAFVWVRNLAWLPAAVFPAVIAQLTLQHIAASARKAEQLQHQALHDRLTDLPNRLLLHQQLQGAIADARHTDASLALLVLDLDRFKEVNDTFGHHVGDLLLRAVGPRLQGVLRDGDMLARLGGDEFAILLPKAGIQTAEMVAAAVIRVLEEPFTLDGYGFDVSTSIGIAAYPLHGDEADTLLLRADVAMYVAKRAGASHAVYDPARDPNSPARLALITDLRRAIEAGELILHYQPKVGVGDGRLTGVEALVRWSHPQHGSVPPDVFIPLAEQTGLIRPLSRWVIDAALTQCRAWRDTGLHLPVAVNLSMADLHQVNLPPIIAALLEAHDVAPASLRLEITESTLMADPKRALATVAHLSEMGVRISIDDFGTGYSSLAYLKRLPVDELKIDRSFARHLAVEEDDRAIVRSTIGLAHELGLTVVTEGVEDAATWQLLKSFGCDEAQGYFMARPMPADEVVAWLTNWTNSANAGSSDCQVSTTLVGASPLPTAAMRSSRSIRQERSRAHYGSR